MTSEDRILHPGSATGEIAKLDEPLSFWGGFDAATGTIVDRSHPQVGICLTGRVAAMPSSRGSSGTPGVLGDALRRGTGPIAIVLMKPDIQLVAGVVVAQALYDINCPVVAVSSERFERLCTGDEFSV